MAILARHSRDCPAVFAYVINGWRKFILLNTHPLGKLRLYPLRGRDITLKYYSMVDSRANLIYMKATLSAEVRIKYTSYTMHSNSNLLHSCQARSHSEHRDCQSCAVLSARSSVLANVASPAFHSSSPPTCLLHANCQLIHPFGCPFLWNQLGRLRQQSGGHNQEEAAVSRADGKA